LSLSESAAGRFSPGAKTDSQRPAVWELQGDEPSVSSARVRDPKASIAPVSADEWPLAALGVLANTRGGLSLNFLPRRSDGVPPEYDATARRAAYLLINRPTPTALLGSRMSNAVEWLSASSTGREFERWKRFFRWLASQDVYVLSDVTPGLLERFRLHVSALKVQDRGKDALLGCVSRLYAFGDELPAADRLPPPEWMDSGFRFRKGTAGPNKTPVIHPDTMDPLLIWALAFIRDFAPDILTAKAHTEKMIGDIPNDPPSARPMLREYLAEHGYLPARQGPGGPRIASLYLAARYGISRASVSSTARDWKGQFEVNVDADTTVGVPITGRIHDRKWTAGIDFHDVVKVSGGGPPIMVKLLQAAALVVVGYLSGMRPHEMLLLERGCVEVVPPPEDHPEGPIHYYLRGRVHKGVLVDGERDPKGTDKRWGTLKPAADAIAVLEALDRDSRFVFASERREAMGTQVAGDRIAEFIEYANGMVADLGLPDAYRIHEDPSGGVDVSAFRRTIAWHIENQPGGDIALAFQYEHAATALGRDGYASASGVGLQKMMGQERAKAFLQLLETVSDALTTGLGVSGPAADRLIAKARAVRPLLATFQSDKDERRILTDPAFQVYDNPQAYSLCVFNRSTAMCHGTDTPDRADCKKSCANHARTDIQISRLREEEQRHTLEAQSPLLPEPLAVRLGQHAAEARATIAEHEKSRRIVMLPDESEDAS